MHVNQKYNVRDMDTQLQLEYRRKAVGDTQCGNLDHKYIQVL